MSPVKEPWFESIHALVADLGRTGYLADESIATSAFLAGRLGKPLLIEGPAGTGKTELARAVSRASNRPLLRLQCYEGLDESKVLYEWNYRKQLLWLQGGVSGGMGGPQRTSPTDQPAIPPENGFDNIFSESFLLERPILQAIRSPEPVVLLIDEVDRIEMETEALLLEVLSDFTVSIPEMGTVTATTQPFTVLTSNATRELSEALKRRCLYLWLDYPSLERERAILMTRLPNMDEKLAGEIVRVVRSLRGLDLKKAPSIAETLDWARTLVELGIDNLEGDAISRTVGSLLKNPSDIEKAKSEGLG